MKNVFFNLLLFAFIGIGCDTQNRDTNTEPAFAKFEGSFLDAYFKQYPGSSISSGYGKYYDNLVIPNPETFANNIRFSKNWISELEKLDTTKWSDNDKISARVLKNQLESDIWYTSVLKPYEWNASQYNISGECDYIINQPYAPLDERLNILAKHLEHADEYYKSALTILNEPTKEHVALAIVQNQGGLAVFGKPLQDSINLSHLTTEEKSTLQQNIIKTTTAMTTYVAALTAMLADKNHVFRSFRIGKELFKEKFRYDIASDLTPEQVYEMAFADKKILHRKMYDLANKVWTKYYNSQTKPADTLQLVQMVLNKVELQHVEAKDFLASLTNQVHELKKFIIAKDLFDFDTINPPINVRLMPEYARGVAAANAEFVPPFQKQGTTYYNIDDITQYSKEKAELALREDNNFGSQILSMHEAVPGHCMQGIYSNKKSPDVLRAVFQNGAMVEGWAVYSEEMMVENGWGNYAPEISLELYRWYLRDLSNFLIDYDIHCLNKPREYILHLLVKEAFQLQTQAESKYHRATVSQVQLCSYYTGYKAIKALREEYKTKIGTTYSLKEFHEKFLSFGGSPVKFIRERMLQ